MSQRETRLKPLVLSVIGGVNERVYDTELTPSQYSSVQGLFPEFAGLQSRLWGKRLLKKYPDAIYGIYQFWTPQGYGGGLYQFDDKLDFGQWLTPTTDFNLDIPPLGADAGGMTLDDFGLPYGSNFGYGTDNACVISFLDGSTDHSACQPPPAPAGTPDDANGGPAGQGRVCQWTMGEPVQSTFPSVAGFEYGHNEFEDSHFTSNPLPYPLPNDLTAEDPIGYVAGSGSFFADYVEYSYKTNLGFGNWIEAKGWGSRGCKGTIDLTPLIADPNNPPSKVEILLLHNSGPPYDSKWEELTGINYGPGGNSAAVPVDVYDYIIRGYKTVPNALGGGFTTSDYVTAAGIRVTYQTRTCSNNV